MLQTIRDRFIGWTLWAVVGIIVVPFAFFGIETFRTDSGDPTVAKAGDQRITQSQFNAAYQQRLAQIQNLMGESFRADQMDQPRFREAVLRDLVQDSVMRQFSNDAGYRASDAQLFEALQQIPAFQDGGKFSSELYRARLANQGYAPDRFESQLRDALIGDQLRDGVLATGFQVPQAAEAAYRLGQQKRWLSYAVFPAGAYLAQVRVSSEQVQARYDEQKTRHQEPERVQLAYLELSQETLAQNTATTPAAEVLRALYDTEKAARFTTPEERAARHVLVAFGADKDAARAQAETLATQLRNGGDFAALAAQHSADPGTQKNGGDLGWIRRGRMTEKFESALFALKKGELSAPVETEFGWHLIQLTDLKPEVVQPFESATVQAQLLEAYRSREADKQFQELSEKLEQLAFESPQSLDAAALALNLKVQTTGWLTRASSDGLFATPAVREAAFSDDVIQDGENSAPLAAGPGRVIVLRKQDYQPPRQRPLDEVAATLRDELRNEAARSLSQAAAAAALAGLKQGSDLQTLALEAGAVMKTPGLVGREAAGVEAPVLAAAFRLPRPANGQAEFAQATLPSGDPVVLVMTAVNDAVVPPADDAAYRTELSRLREATAGAEFSAYRAFIEQQISVKMMTPPEGAPAP